MLLVEKHSIKNTTKNRELFNLIDDYCYKSKNLYNSTNYIITQCSRISYKLKQGEILDSWEKSLLYKVNCGIKAYNDSRPKKTPIKYIDENNSNIADAYFLSWYLKDSYEYKNMPYSTCSQIVIQNLCKNWKSFYQGIKAYKTNPSNMLGMPHKPNYLDKEKGRNAIIITNQVIKLLDNGTLKLPTFLKEIHIKPRHTDISQIRIVTKNNKIDIQIMYKKEETPINTLNTNRVMGIDIGVNNFATLTFNTSSTPIIISGKYIKSVNQYYNKRKAELQEKATILNNQYTSKRMCRLTNRRNNKVEDYLHKASSKIIELAIKDNIGTIVIGNNKGWKQESNMGKVTNQNFVSIPYYSFIKKLQYKAELVGIKVLIVEEKYTSGTSYIDGEDPIKSNYNKSRRKHRGLFISNTGIRINADVNGSYQMMKKANYSIPYKGYEKVTVLKVA